MSPRRQCLLTQPTSCCRPLQDEDLSGGAFEDEDTRVFYECLPDLQSLAPGLAQEQQNAEDSGAAAVNVPASQDSQPAEEETAAEPADSEAADGSEAARVSMLCCPLQQTVKAMELPPKSLLENTEKHGH